MNFVSHLVSFVKTFYQVRENGSPVLVTDLVHRCAFSRLGHDEIYFSGYNSMELDSGVL